MNDDLFTGGQDPFDGPARRKGKPSRGPMIGCPLSWFEWVYPLAKSKRQLGIALCLYRRCCIHGSATVTVPTDAFERIGIFRRDQKHKQLLALERAEIIRVEATRNGHVGKVTLANWPEPA
jgi:hypothetical protein